MHDSSSILYQIYLFFASFGSTMVTLVFATNNQHKLKEVSRILPEWIQLNTLKDIGCIDELPETGATLHANALQKARYIREKFGLNCFADDTGLEVDALDGAPGVYSARYAGKNASDGDNVLKLLTALNGETNRIARFRTVIALALLDQVYYFEGAIEGRIVESTAGNSGFGYDPVFIPQGFDKTFAEMSVVEKNAISHRALAMQKMNGWLVVNKETLT
jgi:XTP/dITP diphosphohydrolase